MAEPILRLKVDSKEYDSKIKRAADGLVAFEDSCRKAGKSMADADKATVDFVKQIGQMGTVNRTAKGSVNELSKAFVELTSQYNKLTAEEKASPFGQALSKSIEQLKGRVQQGRQELDNINQSLNQTGNTGKSTGSILDSLAGKFGMNSAELLKLGGTLGLASGALKVAQDAFFANEQSLDEWGRIVESSHSLYKGFLHALNTGDISGYLSNMNNIVKAARDAYNALDELGTYNAFNQINVEKARTGLNESIADYREGKGSKENVASARDAYIKELETKKKKEEEVYRTKVYQLAAKRQVSGKDLYDALSGTYGNYQTLKGIKPTGREMVSYGAGMFGGSGYYIKEVPKTKNERMGVALRAINDTELEQVQGYGRQALQTSNEIAQIRRQAARIISSGSTSTGSSVTTPRPSRTPRSGAVPVPKTELQLNNEQIEKLSQEYISATEERKTAIKGEIKVLQDRNAEIQKLKDEALGKIAEVIPEGSMKALSKEMSSLKEEQQKATSTSEWQRLQGMIDATQKKMEDLQGKVAPDMGLFSSKNMSALSSSIKQKLDEAEIGTEVYDSLTNQLSDVTALSNLLGEFLKHGIDMADVDAESMWQKIFGGEDVATEELQKMLDKLNAYLAENGLDLMQLGSDGSLSGVKSEEKGKSKFEENLDKTNKGLSGLQTVMSGVQQMGLKIPTGLQDAMNIMQGLMSVVQGVSTIISIFSTASETANTAAVIANTAAVGALTTVMAVNTATSAVPFMRHGGIAHAANGLVAGHDFSDNTPVMVSSGELILNRAQQGNLASQLNGGGSLENLHLETEIHAEKFRIMLNANSKRRGRGEYVTTRTT